MTAFRRIVCAVDGSAAGSEAARQAAVLAQRDTELLLVGVADDAGGEAKRALEQAADLAAKRGVAATLRLARGETSRAGSWTRAPESICWWWAGAVTQAPGA